MFLPVSKHLSHALSIIAASLPSLWNIWHLRFIQFFLWRLSHPPLLRSHRRFKSITASAPSIFGVSRTLAPFVTWAGHGVDQISSRALRFASEVLQLLSTSKIHFREIVCVCCKFSSSSRDPWWANPNPCLRSGFACWCDVSVQPGESVGVCQLPSNQGRGRQLGRELT